MTGRILAAASLVLAACAPEPRWVAVTASDAVLLLDGQLRPVGRLALPLPPQRLAFAPDGASLFITTAQRPGSSLLARLPRGGGEFGGSRLEGEVRRLVFSRDGRTLLLGVGRGETGLAIATTGALAIATAPAACDANDLVATESGERAYVVCADGKIIEVDPALRLVVQVSDVTGGEQPCDPAAAALSANGTVLFVACAGSGILLYLDRVTLAPFDSLAVPPGARRLAVSGRHALLVVPGEDGRTVIVDVRARAMKHVLPTPHGKDVALTAGGKRAFVTAPPRIFEIDLESGQVLRDTTHAGITGVLAVWPGPREPRMRWDDGHPGRVSATVSAAPASR